MTIGERIRHYRTERGWSVKELSEKSGVSRDMLSRWERDKRMPASKSLVKIGRALDVSLDAILGTNGEYTEDNLDLPLAWKVWKLHGKQSMVNFIGDCWTTTRTITLIERGKTTNVHIPVLIDLCAMTGMCVDWLLGIRRK